MTVIKTTSISFDATKNDLLNFALSQADSDRLEVLFASSAGMQLIEYIASLREIIYYENLISKRENYIQSSKMRSSKIGSSQFLGYSAKRGRNAIIDITYVPSSSGVHYAYDIIGTVNEVDLIVLEETAYNAGQELTLRCVVGEVGEETKIASGENLAVFKYRTPKVSEDIKVFIDNKEVEISDLIIDLLQGMAMVQTNPFGSVDVKYLNSSTFSTRFSTGSEVKIVFVVLKDVNFALSDVVLYPNLGTLTNIAMVSLFQDVESMESIEVNAPLRNETKMHVRARRDNEKVLRQLADDIVDAKGADIEDNAGVMNIFYIRENELRYSPAEKVALLKTFQNYRPNGLRPPYIVEASKVNRKYKVVVHRYPRTTGDITSLVNDSFSEYLNKLGVVVNLLDVEAYIEQADFVKVASVENNPDLWQSQTPYVEGSLAKSVLTTHLLEVEKFIYRTGPIEPSWNLNAGGKTIDNDIIWQAFIKDDLSETAQWSSNTSVTYGTRVKPITDPDGLAYRCIGFVNRSSSVEPAWPALDGVLPASNVGKLVYDGNIIWRSLELEGTPTVWEASKVYEGGETVIPVNAVTSDNEGVMYQVFGFTRSSGDTIPDFGSLEIDGTIEDGAIVWKAVDSEAVEFTLKDSQYLSVNVAIEIK